MLKAETTGIFSSTLVKLTDNSMICIAIFMIKYFSQNVHIEHPPPLPVNSTDYSEVQEPYIDKIVTKVQLHISKSYDLLVYQQPPTYIT